MKVKMMAAAVCAAVCALLLAQGETQAQIKKSRMDSEPCCNIVAISQAAALVTARDQAGKTFQFEVKNAALIRSLRVGQSVYADFATGKVSVNGASPCCAIVRPAEPVGKPTLHGVEPCCSITAINAATGIVTATEVATARVFRFEVRDRALLTSLKVGQKVSADFGTSKVRINSLEPCCNIIGHGGGSN